MTQVFKKDDFCHLFWVEKIFDRDNLKSNPIKPLFFVNKLLKPIFLPRKELKFVLKRLFCKVA